MHTTDAFVGLACAECGAVTDYAPDAGRCPHCGGSLDAAYDDVDVSRDAVAAADSMWDLPLLPFSPAEAVTAAEGGTPTVETPRLADELGVGRAVVKDESRNPTGTFHDRGLSLAVTAARDADADLFALASPGNSGQSMAAYAGQLDRRTYAFVPSRAPFSNKALVNVHGGEMKVTPGRFGDALEAVSELQSEYVSLQEFDTPFRHEGAKTVAVELLADLEWDVPDAVFVPVATGELAVGVVKGLRECREYGLVDDVPPVYGVQSAGCAPAAAAFQANRPVEAWNTPDTIVGELEIPDPAGGDRAIDAIRETGGDVLAVEDADILESAVSVAASETIEMGAMGGAAAAGAWERADEFGDDATLALVNTESAAKTPDILRSHLMGQGV